MIDSRPLAVALMGPTASGKSALALEWAQRLGGEILSVDSALVYRGLDIGAAKPTREEQALVRHHLIDVREPWQPYSAAEFAQDAEIALHEISARGKLPILAGGTGLYLSALLDGLSPMPEASAVVRAEISARAEEIGWPALHQELMQIDADAAAKIKPTDPQRIQRALEVFRLSGKPISHWQRESRTRRFPFRVLKFVLAPSERNVLHERIERRFDTMLDAGFLDEVQRLRALPELRGYPSALDLPAIRAVGYRQAWEYLDAVFSAPMGEDGQAFDIFRGKAIAATRQLAKRQLTWLRGELDARWFDPLTQRDGLEEALQLFLHR